MKISFERDNSRVKKTLHLKKNTFIIYSPRAITVNALLTSSFRGHEIIEINSEKTRLWIEILNTSYMLPKRRQKRRQPYRKSGSRRGRHT